MDFKENDLQPSDARLSRRTLQLFHHERSSPFRIGVIIPEFYELTSLFLYGLMATLEDLGVFFSTSVCTATRNDLESNRENIESFLEHNEYDVIVSHGISCTLAAYKITVDRETPHVFVGIRHYKALELRLISSLEYSGNHTTAVLLEKTPFDEQFSELIKYGLSFKNVLVIYNSDGHHLDFFIEEIGQVCAARKLFLEVFEMNARVDYTTDLGPYLDRSDLVLILRDSVTTLEVDTIARLCKQHNTTLCASDWGSVKHGAPMAFGFDEKLIGIATAEKVFFVLEKKIHPSYVPIIALTHTYSFAFQKEKTKNY